MFEIIRSIQYRATRGDQIVGCDICRDLDQAPGLFTVRQLKSIRLAARLGECRQRDEGQRSQWREVQAWADTEIDARLALRTAGGLNREGARMLGLLFWLFGCFLICFLAGAIVFFAPVATKWWRGR